jgi:hypothetical protein
MTRAGFLLSALLALLLACGGEADDEPATPTPTAEAPDATALLVDAALAVANLRSFHFELTQEDAIIPLPPNFDLTSAEGDVLLPDRLAADLETEVQDINVSVDAIAIGSDTWITNPFTRRWQKLDADLRDYADLGALLPSLLPAVQDPRLTGEASLDGVATRQVTGVANSSDLQDALPFALPNREVRIEVWLGVDDSLPRRVRVIGPLISGESDAAVRQIDLSRLNQPVEIDPPT